LEFTIFAKRISATIFTKLKMEQKNEQKRI